MSLLARKIRILLCCALVATSLAHQIYATSYLPLPSNLQEQIGSSALILKGRLGKVIRQIDFYGYNIEFKRDTTEEEVMKRFGKSSGDIKDFSVPLVEYEVIIDEVFYGEPPQDMVLRIYGVDPTLSLQENSLIERLFFLQLNPDEKTFATGRGHQLLNIEGKYYYELFNENLRLDVYTKPDYLTADDSNVDVFESLLKQAIAAKISL